MNTILKPDFLNAQDFSLLKDNPDRGWRIETYLTLGSNSVMFNKGYEPEEFLDRELEHYKKYNIKNIQLYVYLTEYIKQPLDEKAFSQLKEYLQMLKGKKIRALLRFAYEYEDNRKVGPTSSRIFSHMEQIKKWMKENEELIKDTVIALQAGFVGVWGEWHTAKYPHNTKTFLLKICDMTPDFLPIQIRQQKFKDKIRGTEEYSRVGFHDDYLVGVYHKWSTPKSAVGTENFERFKKESSELLNDGEMPWGRDKSYKDGYIDGVEMLEGCKLRSLSTLSLTHNFTEECNYFNAHRWQSEKISPALLDKLNIPYAPNYFKIEGGKSIFQFLTDYLGYQIAVEKIEFNCDELSLLLRNNGFALPYGFNELKLYVESDSGTKEYIFDDYDCKDLKGGCFHEFKVKADMKNARKIGISLKKDIKNLGGIRFANKCEFKDDINIFKI